ncbi:MAG: hypothetical protein JWQ25_491, partial [Daejeonella sp.]|nr:hypothetical protein [Daejeonella sp.]
SSIDAPEFNLITNFQARFSPSAFSISFTQNFGNKSLGERKSRATGSEEERSRVSP